MIRTFCVLSFNHLPVYLNDSKRRRHTIMRTGELSFQVCACGNEKGYSVPLPSTTGPLACGGTCLSGSGNSASPMLPGKHRFFPESELLSIAVTCAPKVLSIVDISAQKLYVAQALITSPEESVACSTLLTSWSTAGSSCSQQPPVLIAVQSAVVKPCHFVSHSSRRLFTVTTATKWKNG